MKLFSIIFITLSILVTLVINYYEKRADSNEGE